LIFGSLALLRLIIQGGKFVWFAGYIFWKREETEPESRVRRRRS